MENDAVLYAVEDSVARVTLNRPDRLNANNRAMSQALTAAMTQAAADPQVRVILLTGAGRAFCAGADAKVLGELSEGSTPAKSGSGDLRYDGLMNLDKPVIAAVHGSCIGIGLIMVCCADIRLASEDAFFVAPFVPLGLCAEGGLAVRLPRLMGLGHATEMLMSGRRIRAQEALAKGLVSQVLPDEGFHEAALAYAKSLAQNSAPRALKMVKDQLRKGEEQTYQEALSDALTLVKHALRAGEFEEAIKARQEKRPPQFPALTCSFGPPINSN